MTRSTAILAALFMATAIGLTVVNDVDRGTEGILEGASTVDGEAPSVLDALNSLGGDDTSGSGAVDAPAVDADAPDLAVPTLEAPEVDAPADGAATENGTSN